MRHVEVTSNEVQTMPRPNDESTDPDVIKNLLTYTETAQLLAVPKGTLYAWVHERKIPYIRLAKRTVRFERAQILAWLAERRVAR